MKHALFEELEAWNPKWREQTSRILDAARQAGPYAVDLYMEWIKTDEGQTYDRLMYGVPNYQAAIQALQESTDRLPVAIATHKDAS